jgi:hypothetical protein
MPSASVLTHARTHWVRSSTAGAAEDHADALVVALCSAVGDEEADVAGCVVAAAHMLGNFVPPAVWVPLILEPISNDKTSPQLRANACVSPPPHRRPTPPG